MKPSQVPQSGRSYITDRHDTDMPAPLGRGTCSPRRIIDPYASHYFAVPPACFALLVWRFCLRVFARVFSLLLFPPLSLVVISRPPSSPPLDSSDSGLTRCLWQEAPLQ